MICLLFLIKEGYKIMYSDIENDYMSETYNDDITTEDETLNTLKTLAKRNDIKAIRRYIIIHKDKLKEYKTRLLNDVINVKGYKFLRRDGNDSFEDERS